MFSVYGQGLTADGTSRYGMYRPSGGKRYALSIGRETIKRLLVFPADTNIVWKSHDDSIAQRSALDQARQEKGTGPNTYSGKRRNTLVEESTTEQIRSAS